MIICHPIKLVQDDYRKFIEREITKLNLDVIWRNYTWISLIESANVAAIWNGNAPNRSYSPGLL